ncbi:unnamed protein product [Brassica rapa subsp. trilocularis]|uniref:(rape) hypothetical protein n=1 Tax=Brassica napus TaxID=3708 RepID=A0A078FYZ3_BRANA|nr:unnamed protein product [Brassica napus]CDY18419.1 BnaA04g21680D [Brassica napus]
MDVGEIIVVTILFVIFVLWVLKGFWRKGGVPPDDGVVAGGNDHGDDSNGGGIEGGGDGGDDSNGVDIEVGGGDDSNGGDTEGEVEEVEIMVVTVEAAMQSSLALS